MGLFHFRKKRPDHSEKVALAYRCYRADALSMLFPGGLDQADTIIRSLAKIYGIQLDSLDALGYHDILTTYTDVFIRKVITQSDDKMIMASLQVNHKNLIQSPETAKKVIAYTNLNMLDNTFGLDSEADMALLSESAAVDNQDPREGQGEEKKKVEVGFYFENILELAIYGKLFGKDRTVNWLPGDAYIRQYQKGYQLADQGDFQGAIKELKACFALNPIGIGARFEMCECYMQLKDFASAKKLLNDMTAYLLDPKHIARYYRRIGYMEIESGNYLAAVACYVYSKNFENHPSIETELQYIRSMVGVEAGSVLHNPVPILEKYHICIMKERKIDDIQPPNG